MANIKLHNAERLEQLWHERIEATSLEELKTKLTEQLGPLPWHFASAKGTGQKADVVVLGFDNTQSEIRPDLPFMVVRAMGYVPLMGHREPTAESGWLALGTIKTTAFDANTAQSVPGQGEAASEAADEAEREIEG